MVLQTWIIECLKTYKESDKIINFITKAIKKWKVELIAGNQSLAEVKTQRGILLGDSLSPLLFALATNNSITYLGSVLGTTNSKSHLPPHKKNKHLIYVDDIKIFSKNEKEKWKTLIQAISTHSQDIEIEFGIVIAMLIMKSGKRKTTEKRRLRNQESIRTLRDKENYQYLGILEAGIIKQTVIKENK